MNFRYFSSFFLLQFCLYLPIQADKPVLLVVGTRPEGIKMIPVYRALKSKGIPTVLCSTGQHAQLLRDVFQTFQVHPDYELNLMKEGQDLFYLTTSILENLKQVIHEVNPALILVQGDTTTAMASALAAFYLKIPVGHVEAGLRTYNIYGPFPEEANRKIICQLSSFHFAPTQLAQERLIDERVNPEAIFCVGNTVVDALFYMQNQINLGRIKISFELEDIINVCREKNKKILLLTAHRRESFGQGLENIFQAMNTILNQNPDLAIIFPMHPNPAIKKTFEQSLLYNNKSVFVLDPLSYHDLIYLLDQCDFIATDSGGIQEEAISLDKNVLILRNETDRPEGIYRGLAQLVGTDLQKIIDGFYNHYDCFGTRKNKLYVYGDGHAGEKIADIIEEFLYLNAGDQK